MNLMNHAVTNVFDHNILNNNVLMMYTQMNMVILNDDAN